MLRLLTNFNAVGNSYLIHRCSLRLVTTHIGSTSLAVVQSDTKLHRRGIRNYTVFKTKDEAATISSLQGRFSPLLGKKNSSVKSGLLSVAGLNACPNRTFCRGMASKPDDKDDDDNDNDDDDNNNKKGHTFELDLGSNIVYINLLFIAYLIIEWRRGKSNLPDDDFVITWSTFYKSMLVTGEVEKLVVNQGHDLVYVYLHRGANINNKPTTKPGPHYAFSISDINNLEGKLSQAQQELGIDPAHFVPVQYKIKSDFEQVLNVAIMTFLLGVGLYYLAKRVKVSFKEMNQQGGPFGVVQSKATVTEPGSVNGVKFKDVAGMQEAKQEVIEFIDYLTDPTRFTELGAKIPKGALLVGPPGTGKTLLAKAVATEAAVPFFSVAGTDFVEMFGGVGPARVRNLFSQARMRSPCIVYVDEIDSIGRARSSGSHGVNMERENTLNQLLVEMDGMNTVEGVVMMASTNRADILDKALLRPGRFDRIIEIPLPTLLERQEIFEIYLNKLKLLKPAHSYSKRLAELTPQKSGADISNICNEAALHAARLNENHVDSKNFDYAIERIIAGIEKKSHSLSPEERKIIAYHEAGHALVGWMLEHTEALLKVSIAPHTNSVFGYALHLPMDRHIWTLEQAVDRMSMSLGGRVAESHVFRKLTTGSEDDLKKITRMARHLIIECGMNPRVGNISFSIPEEGEFRRRFYSDALQQIMDEEVNHLIGKAWESSVSIIGQNEGKLHQLAKQLLEKEVLSYENIEAILGPCPHGDKRKLTSASNI